MSDRQPPLPEMAHLTASRPPFVWAWIFRHSPASCQALIKRECDFNPEERFYWEAAGWELVEDKGASVKEVRENLANGTYIDRNLQDVYAYDHPCVFCGSYAHTDLVTAKQWLVQFGVVTGSRPFRGYLCEPCQHNDDRFSDVRKAERAGVA